MKKAIPIIAAVAGIIGVMIFLQAPPESPEIEKTVETPSLYVLSNSMLKERLAEHKIQMSSPIKLSNQEDIKKYCSFFTSEQKQQIVQYCTSTELKDESGVFLGNIHMVGTTDEPKIILALIQTESTTDLGAVKTVFATLSDVLVCDCWAEQKPGGLADMGQWVDGLYQFHTSNAKPHSKSNVLQLEGKSLQLELSANEQGYLWQFFIYS
jgi:hypothetical protein